MRVKPHYQAAGHNTDAAESSGLWRCPLGTPLFGLLTLPPSPMTRYSPWEHELQGKFFSMERFLQSKCFANPSWAADNESWLLDFQACYISLRVWLKKKESIKYVARDSRQAGSAAVQTFGHLPRPRGLPALRPVRTMLGNVKYEIREKGVGSKGAGATEQAASGPLAWPNSLQASPRQDPISPQQFCVWGGQGRMPHRGAHYGYKRSSTQRWEPQGPGVGQGDGCLHDQYPQRPCDPERWGPLRANKGSGRGAGCMEKPDVTPSHFCSGANGLLFSSVLLKVLGIEGSMGFLIWLCVLP